MDLMTGGDLRHHLGKLKRFNEAQTKFFTACIIVGLEYIHVNDIIHRDIKPENLVLDSRGYVRLTDFGVARILIPENASDTSGTPGYMAPEVMCRHNHGIEVDYFALGVIIYEFMTGRRPYVGKSRKEIRDQILSRQVFLRKQDVPESWSYEAADFANRLLQRKPSNRLGANGASEVKNHVWLRDFPWQKLYEKQLDPPYVPPHEENFADKRQLANDPWMAANINTYKENYLLLRQDSVQNLFN